MTTPSADTAVHDGVLTSWLKLPLLDAIFGESLSGVIDDILPTCAICLEAIPPTDMASLYSTDSGVSRPAQSIMHRNCAASHAGSSARNMDPNTREVCTQNVITLLHPDHTKFLTNRFTPRVVNALVDVLCANGEQMDSSHNEEILRIKHQKNTAKSELAEIDIMISVIDSIASHHKWRLNPA